MEFTNEAGFPATLARAQLFYARLTLATVVVKASFDIDRKGEVVPVPTDQQLAVSESDVKTDVGQIDGDVVPTKPGCDVAVLGHARSPRADRPVEEMGIHLRIGEFVRSMHVFGDRAWVDTTSQPRTTRPIAFTTLPLTNDRAFGGEARAHGELVAPYAANPEGRGLVMLRERAAGTRLPNLEEADQLISSWEQQPLPAGLAPLSRHSSLRFAGGGFKVDQKAETVQLAPAAFSFAHPRMKMRAYAGGTPFELRGMTHDEPLRFTLPEARFGIAVKLGNADYQLPLVTDTLCVFPDYRRLFVVARRAFVYEVRPQRRRWIRLFAGTPDATQASPGVTTIAEQRQAQAPVVPIQPAMAKEAMPLPLDDLMALYPLTEIVEQLPLCPSG
jgi:hypothetical protein